MKRSIFIGILFLFLAIAIKINADMKITPDGATSPDNSASIHLRDNLSSNPGNYGPDGAVISGVNSNKSQDWSAGGYFEASGPTGSGVLGISSTNAVWGIADGQNGMAVHDFASNSGDGTNYGGHFQAAGTTGTGVQGTASGTYGRGVQGTASGTDGIGVHGFASNEGNVSNSGGYFVANGTTGRGVQGYGKGASATGVYGNGKQYDFYADGTGANYGPFTGAHEVKFARDMSGVVVPGLVVATTGKTEARKNESGRISLSSTLPTVTLSTKANDKAVFGVIVSDGPLPKNHWYESQEGENFGVVNAVGEGRAWVTNRNGNIENGDYVTTSEIPGHGQMQDDDFLHSYTLGKAIETVDWEEVNDTVEYGGMLYKRYLIAIVYTSG